MESVGRYIIRRLMLVVPSGGSKSWKTPSTTKPILGWMATPESSGCCPILHSWGNLCTGSVVFYMYMVNTQSRTHAVVSYDYNLITVTCLDNFQIIITYFNSYLCCVPNPNIKLARRLRRPARFVTLVLWLVARFDNQHCYCKT